MTINEGDHLRCALERYLSLFKQATDPRAMETLWEMIQEVKEQLRAVEEPSDAQRFSASHSIATGNSIVELPSGSTHRPLQDLCAYWMSKKGSQIAPPRWAMHPEEISTNLLSNIALFDVIEKPLRFRFRLFGPGLVMAYGEDISGKYLDEIDLSSISPDILDHMTRMVRQCRPQAVQVHFKKQTEDRYLEYERIGLPLSEDGVNVNMVLCGFAFTAT